MYPVVDYLRRYNVFAFINYLTANQDSNAFSCGPLRCLVLPCATTVMNECMFDVEWYSAANFRIFFCRCVNIFCGVNCFNRD